MPEQSAKPRDEIEQTIRDASSRGDFRTAVTRIVETYGPEIRSFLGAWLRRPEDANDAYASFSEHLIRGLPGFSWRCAVRTWCYTLARNAAFTILRDPRRQAARNLPLGSREDVPAEFAVRDRSVTQDYRRTDVKDRFRALREQLSLDDQMLLVLRVDRGLKWRETAIAMLGDERASDDTIERESVRLRKAFQRVTNELRELGARGGLIRSD